MEGRGQKPDLIFALIKPINGLMAKIKIIFSDFEVLAELNHTETAKKILSLLPIESRANRWGEEIYFEIPLKAGLEKDAREEVEIGELGYWPEGNAFCIFFGPTPVSRGEKPRAYSKVNIIGKLLELPKDKLKSVQSGAKIKIEQAEKEK